MGKTKLIAFRLPAVGLITNIASCDPKYFQKNKLQVGGDCLPWHCLMLRRNSPLPVSFSRLKYMLDQDLCRTHSPWKDFLFSQELNISLKPCFSALVPNHVYQIYGNDIHFKMRILTGQLQPCSHPWKTTLLKGGL